VYVIAETTTNLVVLIELPALVFLHAVHGTISGGVGKKKGKQLSSKQRRAKQKALEKAVARDDRLSAKIAKSEEHAQKRDKLRKLYS